jgi:hypothetical protein
MSGGAVVVDKPDVVRADNPIHSIIERTLFPGRRIVLGEPDEVNQGSRCDRIVVHLEVINNGKIRSPEVDQGLHGLVLTSDIEGQMRPIAAPMSMLVPRNQPGSGRSRVAY